MDIFGRWNSISCWTLKRWKFLYTVTLELLLETRTLHVAGRWNAISCWALKCWKLLYTVTLDVVRRSNAGSCYTLARWKLKINSSTFCLGSSSCRTDLSIHFTPSRPITILMIFLVALTLSSSIFYYETDHRKCEITLGGWHYGLRLFKLGRLLRTGFEPWSLAWLACSTGQSATTYTTVA